MASSYHSPSLQGLPITGMRRWSSLVDWPSCSRGQSPWDLGDYWGRRAIRKILSIPPLLRTLSSFTAYLASQLTLPSLEYDCKRRDIESMVLNDPAGTAMAVEGIWSPYHTPALTTAVLAEFRSLPLSQQTTYLLEHYHHLSPPSTSSPWISCITLASGYFIGGFIPLIPYLCVQRKQVFVAFFSSIAVVVVCLFAFGWVKTGSVVGWKGRREVRMGILGAVQMVGLGAFAAAAAVGIVKGINQGQKGV